MWYLTLTETFDNIIDEAIRIGKETGIEIRFDRDGCHGTDDLNVILKFQKAGFAHEISYFKGKHEDKAIRVTFMYTPSK